MLWVVVVAIGLVLYCSRRALRAGAEPRWDSEIDMNRKSPFGRWRY